MRKSFSRDERGQAVVEYMLMITLVLILFGAIGITFRKTLFSLWSTLTNEVAAGCPGCSPPSGRNYKIK